MSQVTVTIAGKTYRMACADGEEGHLEGLAAAFDGKIEEMRAAAGEIGDMRLHVMAALMVTDELAEAKQRIGALERDMATLRTRLAQGDHRAEAFQSQMIETLTRASERIERLARTLNPVANQ
jgi:cell division protein ZapA